MLIQPLDVRRHGLGDRGRVLQRLRHQLLRPSGRVCKDIPLGVDVGRDQLVVIAHHLPCEYVQQPVREKVVGFQLCHPEARSLVVDRTDNETVSILVPPEARAQDRRRQLLNRDDDLTQFGRWAAGLRQSVSYSLLQLSRPNKNRDLLR